MTYPAVSCTCSIADLVCECYMVKQSVHRNAVGVSLVVKGYMSAVIEHFTFNSRLCLVTPMWYKVSP